MEKLTIIRSALERESDLAVLNLIEWMHSHPEKAVSKDSFADAVMGRMFPDSPPSESMFSALTGLADHPQHGDEAQKMLSKITDDIQEIRHKSDVEAERIVRKRMDGFAENVRQLLPGGVPSAVGEVRLNTIHDWMGRHSLEAHGRGILSAVGKKVTKDGWKPPLSKPKIVRQSKELTL
jgi:hypothetical protein